MLKSVYAELDGKPVPMIVDLGYLDDRRSRNAADKLLAFGISKRRLSIEGNGRLLVEIPPRQSAAVLRNFQIEPGETYWRATHHWKQRRGARR